MSFQETAIIADMDACLQFATEAAITILRIDDMIKIMPGPDDDMEG